MLLRLPYLALTSVVTLIRLLPMSDMDTPAATGIHQARYIGLGKVDLEHAFAASAINLIRLYAWWNGTPLQRTRTTHLSRLNPTLAA